MDLIATTSSTAWRRSVRRRAPVSESDDGERELARRVEELEDAVEGLRLEKNAAEAEEAALRAELDAERGAAESLASETMLMIERLQREKAAALLEARQYRRLAEGRVERDRQLHDQLASLSALVAGYLAILHAHGISPADEDRHHEEERPVDQHVEPEAADREMRGEDGMDAIAGTAVKESTEEELECTKERGCAAPALEDDRADGALDLYARVEALEADSAVTRREVATVRAEPARVVLAREVARRLCRAAAAAAERRTATTTTMAQKPRFSMLAICKVCMSDSMYLFHV